MLSHSDSNSRNEQDWDSYVIIETPSPALKNKQLVRTKAIGSPSPRILRARRMRAFTTVAERDVLVNSIDLGRISQQFKADFSSSTRWTYKRDKVNVRSPGKVVIGQHNGRPRLRLESFERESKSKNEAEVPLSRSKPNRGLYSYDSPKNSLRARSYTVASTGSPVPSTSAKRSKGNVKRSAYRRATQSLSSMASRKVPIVPAKYALEDSTWRNVGSTGRKISVTAKKTRRRSEPFLFASAGRLRKTSTAVPARQFQVASHKRRLSTTNALLPSTNKIRLQELANTELLASLNEPFVKEGESEHETSDDEKDSTDYALSEAENELQKLTELKRVKVIEEIFETEKKYISCLNTLDKVFKAPMLDGGIAQDKDVNALFPSCLSTIKECHSWFMEQLENRMKSDDWSGGIGDILGKMAGPLKENLLNVYTDYVNAFPKSISTFSKCSRASHKFRKFIEECYCKSDNLDLPSYLITPVQRLPRYVLLLRQLSKYTNEDHPDNESIEKALHQMEELIGSLNSSIHNSMQAYTARESETRKTIRRQLSRRRKKPRPISLNLKELTAAEERAKKATSPDQSDRGIRRNSLGDHHCLKTVHEKTPSDERDARGLSPLDAKQHCLRTHENTAASIALRKQKAENRKSLRKSIGAALSSLLSPREDKDVSRNRENQQKLSETDMQGDANANGNFPLRRKVGVAYPSPSEILGTEDAITNETPKAEEGIVKRRRFSGSFRERSRNLKIQIRRRSGTWFSASAEKNSDLDLASNCSSNTNTPSISISDEQLMENELSVSPRRNTKSRSSFISMFKRKSKLNTDEKDEPVRRRSDCHRKLDNSELVHQQLSTSISAPIITDLHKDSKGLTVAEVISEETVEIVNGKTACLKEEDIVLSEQLSETENIQANGSNHEHENIENHNNNEKKHKKGKLMRTIRTIMGKGKH